MGPLARYVKLLVAHAPGMPGTFFPPPQVSDPDMHHGTCVTHVPWCMPGSLTTSFLWNRWRGKCSRHSRRMRNPQFYVSGKRPMMTLFTDAYASAGLTGLTRWDNFRQVNHKISFIDFSPVTLVKYFIYISAIFLCSFSSVSGTPFINTLRPKQNGRHFADDNFKPIFLKDKIRISIKISLMFVPKSPITNIPALFQIMAWRRPGDKPLSEAMVVSLLTHICVARPQWVNKY